MVTVILVSHGGMAKGMVESLERISPLVEAQERMRIFDYDGNVIATGSFSFGGFFHSDKYTIEVKEEEGSKLRMDFEDKMCAFLKLDYKVNSDYGD